MRLSATIGIERVNRRNSNVWAIRATWNLRTTSPTDVKRAATVDRDRALVEAAQRGDQAAFVDLVHSCGDRLVALAHRILRDVDRAEDALQDALGSPGVTCRGSAIRSFDFDLTP